MVNLTINGRHYSVNAEPDTPLLFVLRDTLGLTGTKYGCGIAQCGACTVHLDGQATRSCQVPLESVGTQAITTIEAIEQDAVGRKVVEAWVGTAGAAMRLLPVRSGHGRHRPAEADAAPDRRRHRRGDDESLPLRDLQRHRRRRAAGGRLRSLPCTRSLAPLLPPAVASSRGPARALVLSALLPARMARAEAQGPAEGAGALAPKPGTRVAAFLEIHPDGTIKLLSPFVEGGQGIATGMAQIVGEELDVPPSRFVVECAPPGPDYAVVNGIRMTGGSFSTRSSYETMRRLGATARDLMIRAAAARLKVQDGELTTRDGMVLHAATNRSLSYGDLAVDALKLKPNESVPLRDPATFRYIRQPIPRLDVRDKSTGRAVYAIDQKVDRMLHAAVQHAPRLGTEPKGLTNESDVKAMPGVHSVHLLPGAVAVAADSWWRARKAVEALKVEWSAPKPSGIDTVAADFSSDGMLAALKASTDPGHAAEEEGDVGRRLRQGRQGGGGRLRGALPRPRAVGTALGHRAL